MPTSSKPTSKRTPNPASKPKPTPRVKRSAKASSPSRRPFLRFYHSESLRDKTLAVLTTLEKGKDPREHRGELADIVAELTDAGMEYYFLRPLKVAKVGFFTQQSANLGMAATTRVLGTVIRNIIGGMDNPQLLAVCRYIRQLME